jgi:hypothetical protein
MQSSPARSEVRPTRLDPPPARIEPVVAASAKGPAVRPSEMLERMTTPPASTLASRYFDLLAQEGFRPNVASDEGPTIITFRAEGVGYLLLVEENDPEFFHLATAYELRDVDFVATVTRANELNEELKATKITVWPPDGSIRIHVESYVDSAPVSIGVLERTIGAIQVASRRFFEPARPPDRLDA